MIIDKQGKVLINEREYKNKYDRNEQHGYAGRIGDKNMVSFYEILKEIYFKKYKITISKVKDIEMMKDCRSIAFDPFIKEDTNG